MADLELLDWTKISPDLSLLTPTEIEVLSKRKHAQRSLISRYLLKQRLSERLGSPPLELPLVESDHGKLFLKNHPCYFSISHSGDLMALAFHSLKPIGVDLETWNRAPQICKIADRYFKPSELLYLKADPQALEQRALQIWTSKEALLKAEDSNLFAAIELREINFTSGRAQHRIGSFEHDHKPGKYYLTLATLTETIHPKVTEP